MSHIRLIKGDYIFYAWKDGEYKRLCNTIRDLESKGFALKETEEGFQDVYSLEQEVKRMTISEIEGKLGYPIEIIS